MVGSYDPAEVIPREVFEVVRVLDKDAIWSLQQSRADSQNFKTNHVSTTDIIHHMINSYRPYQSLKA